MPDVISKSLDEASRVTSREQLGALYNPPREVVRMIETPELDAFARDFISRSPLVMIGTEGDVASKGDAPGFVRVVDDRTLLIPERAGNNRLDTLGNILRNPVVGLMFMIPGVNEVMRIGGTAEITDDAAWLEPMAVQGKAPRTAIIIHVEQVFYNCARAFMRSKLWDPAAYEDHSDLPTPARVVALRNGRDPDEFNRNYQRLLSDLYENP
jgi:PPOX class probable FMN-dependent enzyme